MLDDSAHSDTQAEGSSVREFDPTGMPLDLSDSTLSGEAIVLTEVWEGHELLGCILKGPPEWGDVHGSSAEVSRCRFVYARGFELRRGQTLTLESGKIVRRQASATQ